MNILFIGGAGFIGSSLVKRFVSDKKYLVFILEPEFANRSCSASSIDIDSRK